MIFKVPPQFKLFYDSVFYNHHCLHGSVEGLTLPELPQ